MIFLKDIIKKDRQLYHNALASPADIADFVLEGQAKISFDAGRLRMENCLSPDAAQTPHFVLWCPQHFPDNVQFSFDFYPLADLGLSMFFFAATGLSGQDIFDSALPVRDGAYAQYHSGDINAFHVSYFRRASVHERAFRTCNLRKSKGFFLVDQGADPLPPVADAASPYTISVVKCAHRVLFAINDLVLFDFYDDGQQYGSLLGGGKAGFRQMAPLCAEYANFSIHSVTV